MTSKLFNNQKGLAQPVLIGLVVLVMAAIGFSAYRIGASGKDDKQQQNNSSVNAANNSTAGKKTYSFEKTSLKIDIPEGWQVNIQERTASGYDGEIKASNGWGISFRGDQGGYGGGPGCNYQNMDPDLPACPTWKVLSSDKLATGDILVSYAASTAGQMENSKHCAIVDKPDDINGSAGASFSGDMWTCFGTIEVNKDPANGADIGDMPINMRISVIFPYRLDEKASTDFTNDADYKAVMEALKTLRKD